ncbi:SDR family NAD(P)-dependent oxidoreductase [Nocardia caishijiensis]|uniref:Enoyl-ACP reductase-like protein n=1 Tax=Nocardia caishijiensis TaxID=184756 RepID=A0ABQ6YV34_9NOCA|nr:SDR family oxidoreductase [Nocardia caishijiensis]KAF0849658.1 enoyl-ACP reductase-like protein [Nocardia caishijiensis]
MGTLAIFGYGPGLGAGTAQVFGRNGFRIAAVGRNADTAAERVTRLRADGIEAESFTADITDPAQLSEVIVRIEQQLGPIDVAVHAAAAGISVRSESTRAVDRAALEVPFALKVYSSIQLARELLPGMLARGRGALLFSSGASEANTQPYLANMGVALGAQRAYVRQLAAELDGTGLYAGLLAIGALIENSAVQHQVDAHPELIPAGMVLPRIGNAELGAEYWRMYTERDTVEVEIGFS